MPAAARAASPAASVQAAAFPLAAGFFAPGSDKSSLKRSAIVAPPAGGIAAGSDAVAGDPVGSDAAAGDPVGLTFSVFLIVMGPLYHFRNGESKHPSPPRTVFSNPLLLLSMLSRILR